jgi:predicted membrane-bound spermidine synthase
MSGSPRRLFFFLFALSGFSGLIYESIWTHYLKLFLGHAAYAQTVVLAIFMGGMAFGSWLCSRRSPRWGNLLAGYALAEGVVGLFALAFHELFDGATRLSYLSVLPALSPAGVVAYKWTLSALLILPQSILLGMTFPLMTGGILRAWPERPGRSLALLYFANSLGAVIGVLASGFWLVGAVGLPGAVRAAGVVNLALAVVVFRLARGIPQPQPGGASSTPSAAAEGLAPPPGAPASTRWQSAFLAASLLTGAASFLYEIGWIRMLSLVLGSSTHAFELMLAAFILGLAFGGLWIQRRIDRIADPARFLGWVQVGMGLCALSTLLSYNMTFRAMQRLLELLEKSDGGYALFNLASHGIALVLMLPATFCAGTTLPLITVALMRRGQGEKSIGAVYAANTVGAIAGVFLGVHVGFPLLGLKGVIGAGAAIDASLGLALLWASGKPERRHSDALATAGVAAALAAAMLFVRLDVHKMASGVYRSASLLSPSDTEVLFHEDGKTATVSVTRRGSTIAIRTNGKVDAGVNMDPNAEGRGDEATMILSAVLPLSLNPKARTAANIGLGCGLTTHTLLLYPGLESLDTIEIERKMVEGARFFGSRVDRAFRDPRSRIHIDDAKSFFSASGRKYDLIVSEPSNPWVSGTAGLFSVEFYRQVRRHLADDGVFAQWMQMYEIDADLVISVVKALSESFPDFVAYATNAGDILFVSRNHGTLPPPDPALFRVPEIRAALASIAIRSVQDLEFRKIGDRKVFRRLVETKAVPANSDYRPYLDQNAARARFRKAKATEFVRYAHMPLPAYEILSGTVRPGARTEITPTVVFGPTLMAYTAMGMRDYILGGSFTPAYDGINASFRDDALRVRRIFFEGKAEKDAAARRASLYNVGSFLSAFLLPGELDAVWSRLESGPAAGTLSAAERGWVTLFRAIGRRDARGTDRAAKALREIDPGMPTTSFQYLATAGLLAAEVTGDPGDRAFWGSDRGGLRGRSESRLLLRMLSF